MEILLDSFKYGVGPALIIVCYLIIKQILDNRKKSIENKHQYKINKEVIDCLSELTNYMKTITKDIVEKDSTKFQLSIVSSFKAMAYMINKFAIFTIISNNVNKNQDIVKENIYNCVNSEFSNIINNLILFDSIKIQVKEYIEESWKNEIIKGLEKIIFDSSSTKEEKIYNVTNKLNMRINNYINIINVKVFDNNIK